MSRWKYLGVLAIISMVAVLGVACGDDDPTTAPSTGTAATTGTASATGTGTAASGEPFKIGVSQSLTGAGETYGQVGSNAIQMAADEINAAGGVNGRQIQLVVEDDKCTAADSITAYTKLTQVDGVKIVLGTSCSGAMLGICPQAETDGVVYFTGLASNAKIADCVGHLRNIPSDAALSVDAANLMWSKGVRKLATVNEATDYSTGVIQGILPRWEELGGELVAQERFESAETDFRTLLAKVIESTPDAVLIEPQAESAGGTLVKQLRELGYTGPVYGASVLTGTTAQDIGGEAMDGVTGVFAELDPNNAKSTEFATNFRAKYNYLTLAFYAAASYDTMKITAQCLAETGDDQNTEAFLACAHAIQNYEGTMGTYHFDEKGEAVGLANSEVVVLPVAERKPENGGFKVIGPIAAPTP